MKVNSNVQGMIAQAILSSNEEKMAKSTQKMSSGYKLNYAKDNPAGMAITNRMRAQLKSLDRANKNAKNAINAVQTAEGAMNEIEGMLQRMNELSVQASNGTMTEADRDAIQEEVAQLSREITRISKDTTYNSQPLLDGSLALKGYSSNSGRIVARDYSDDLKTGKYVFTTSSFGDVTVTKDGKSQDILRKETTPLRSADGLITGYSSRVFLKEGGEITIDSVADSTSVEAISIERYGGMKIQTGAEEGQEIQVVIPEISLVSLGLEDLTGELSVNCKTEDGAKRAIDMVGKAIDRLSAARSRLGAYQNRLEKTVSNLDVTTENLTESYSTIKDIDMAEGMVEYTTLQVLIQAGTTMLAQANEQPQQALQLLQ